MHYTQPWLRKYLLLCSLPYFDFGVGFVVSYMWSNAERQNIVRLSYILQTLKQPLFNKLHNCQTFFYLALA